MTPLICPTCGCSLVRLGISKDKAIPGQYEGEEYHFCCQACIDLFKGNPEKYLEETSDLIICPSCLAEKPLQSATTLQIAGQEVHFCRCPHCPEVFQKDPDYYVKRLAGTGSSFSFRPTRPLS